MSSLISNIQFSNASIFLLIAVLLSLMMLKEVMGEAVLRRFRRLHNLMTICIILLFLLFLGVITIQIAQVS